MNITEITLATMSDDAFFHNVIRKLRGDTDGIEDLPDRILGKNAHGTVDMRISLTNGMPLKNVKSTFGRKVFVQVMDPEDDTAEQRLDLFEAFKQTLEHPQCNKCGTLVHIQKPGWDKGNPDTSVALPKLDNFVVYKDIVTLTKELFEDVGPDWGTNNPESAACFFTAGNIPHEAHADLGIPIDHCMDA